MVTAIIITACLISILGIRGRQERAHAEEMRLQEAHAQRAAEFRASRKVKR
jgi:type II secretory pathway pseudopilin PulG